jgi:DNA-directed RNA polymerase subunit RPC12/RpoP
LPKWAGWFNAKTRVETTETQQIYSSIGFCSASCSLAFWGEVRRYPLEEIGTDTTHFAQNLRKLWYKAILRSLACSPTRSEAAITAVNLAIQLETKNYKAIPLGITDDGTFVEDAASKVGNITLEFVNRGHLTLAQNLEKCGRPLDAADIYEKYLRNYDKARQLREKDKHVIVKQTDISINLNALLQQLKDGGIVALYRCPHCNGTLKIGKDTSAESLKVCEHCGSKIETFDLADFLKTALS